MRGPIADLVHRYCDAVTRRDLEQWASCWAPDGRWELSADRVACEAADRLAILRGAFDVLEGVVQMAANGTVTETGPDAATGRWYIVEHSRRRTGEPLLLLAHYEDRYICTGGTWLFAARTLVPHYKGRPDLSGTFLT